ISSSHLSEYVAEGLESTGERLDAVGALSVIVRDTPRAVPYQNGRTLGLFFVAFIPRVVWPDKPEITMGQWMPDMYGSVGIENNTAVTALGDYYLNFGTLGVIGGMLFLGMIMRLTHECLLRDRPTPAGMLGAVVILYCLIIRFENNVATQYALAVFA